MVEQAIATLKELPGVFGVCVYDAEQNLILNNMPPSLTKELLEGLGMQIQEIISQAREKLPQLSNLTLHYDEISLIVRPHTHKTIVVIGEPKMNERMVGFSLNLLVKPKPLESKNRNPVSAPEKIPASIDVSAHIPELKQALAKIVGPMADIIFDDAMSKWQQSGGTSFKNLLEILHTELGDTQQYERYLELCSGTIAEIKQLENFNG
jgi:hypothetical protein